MGQILNLRRQMGGEMLPYDAEIEYLESSGAQYIDTGISGGANDLEIGCKFRYTKYVMYAAIYGNYISDAYNSTRFILGYLDSGQAFLNNNRLSYTGGNTEVNISINTIHTSVSKYTTYTIDGITNTVTQTASGTTNNDNIALFNRSVINSVTRDIGLEVYSFYIKKSGTLIRDFIPVRVGNVGYMYDKVTKQLFGNAGTGAFILGPDK